MVILSILLAKVVVLHLQASMHEDGRRGVLGITVSIVDGVDVCP